MSPACLTAVSYTHLDVYKRQVLNVKNTYTSVSDRIGDYKSLLEDFNAKILKRGRIESADTLNISINARGLRAIAREGEQLYKSVSDLVLYATGCLLYTSRCV